MTQNLYYSLKFYATCSERACIRVLSASLTQTIALWPMVGLHRPRDGSVSIAVSSFNASHCSSRGDLTRCRHQPPALDFRPQQYPAGSIATGAVNL